MNLFEAVTKCFHDFVTFSGRASRSEYWYFVLFSFLVGMICGFLDAMLFGQPDPQATSLQPIASIAQLVLFLPSLSVGIRRLHDTNRSGWWILIAFTIIGLIPLIYWYCIKGTQGDNRFGPDPLGQTLLPPVAPTQSQQL